MFESIFWGLLVVCIGMTPLVLPLLQSGTIDFRSSAITLAVTALAIGTPYAGFGDPGVVLKFLLAQTLLFASFVCVSRIRQRKSLFLQALAGIGSNAGWFLAMQVLAGAYLAQKQGLANVESVGLIIAAIAGTIIGRLVGAQWMMWVEKRFAVRTDSVGNSNLKWLDERTQPALLKIFIGTLVIYAAFSLLGYASIIDVAVVMALGFAQSNVYTVNARFANRDHPGWPVLTNVLGGTIFMVHWAYLIGYTQAGGFMPLALFVPYTVSTVYGANSGAVLSMMLEKMLGIEADTHTKSKDKSSYKEVTWHRPVLISIGAFCGVYLALSGSLFAMMGIQPSAIVLPFTLFAGTGWERPASLLVGGFVFFATNITHTLSSRAGNRNHAPYHAITCVIHGVVTFATSTFVVLNASFLDLIPVAAFGSSVGQLFAQSWSMKMEAWLVSVMDPPKSGSKGGVEDYLSLK